MRIAFGDSILDTGSRELRRQGRPVHLPPKAFQLLEVLLASRPRALSKEDLLERLWPGTFVTEASLSNLIADLRRAIGDEARRPRLIRTVHGFGYAWNGDALDAAERPPAAGGLVHRLIWQGREVALEPGENVLGRVPDAVVWIADRAVSRRHARILVDERGATLEDLGSKNGTLLNGRPLAAPAPLADGDEIGLGEARIGFRSYCVAADSTETSFR
jgi:DNA-binding winged helix-turn-helix (wHTH) protein